VQASLLISLATTAAKLLVGGFFLAFWVGVFSLNPPEKQGACEKGCAAASREKRGSSRSCCRVPGYLRAPGSQGRPSHADTKINSSDIVDKASTLSPSS
jgi:hypothetical protein